jgi:hypothetical protein
MAYSLDAYISRGISIIDASYAQHSYWLSTDTFLSDYDRVTRRGRAFDRYALAHNLPTLHAIRNVFYEL